MGHHFKGTGESDLFGSVQIETALISRFNFVQEQKL